MSSFQPSSGASYQSPTRVTDTIVNVLDLIRTSNPVMFKLVTILNYVNNPRVTYSLVGISMPALKTQRKHIPYDEANFTQNTLEVAILLRRLYFTVLYS